MLVSACQFSVPLFGFGLIYLVFVVGALLSPGKWADHLTVHRRDLSEVKNKASAWHWTAPFFILGLPFIALVSLTVLMPWLAGLLGLGAMLIPLLVCS